MLTSIRVGVLLGVMIVGLDVRPAASQTPILQPSACTSPR